MKKTIVTALCLGAAALSVFIVSCKKNDVTQTTATKSTGTTQQANNSMAARDGDGIPTDPGTPPNPNEFILGGQSMCLYMTYQITTPGDIYECDQEDGIICNWHVFPCETYSGALILNLTFRI